MLHSISIWPHFWSGFAIVAAGCWIAPTPEMRTPAITLAIIGCCMGILAILVRVQQAEWFRVLDGLTVLAAVVVGTMQQIKKDR